MSASPFARQACSQAQSIPSKRVLITDASQMPEVYSSTPGGTCFSTTPGGTRIIYEKAFLMNLKNSPLSKTPPKIPGHLHLMKGEPNNVSPNQHQSHFNNRNNHHHNHHHNNNGGWYKEGQNKQNHNKINKSEPHNDDSMFDMDI